MVTVGVKYAQSLENNLILAQERRMQDGSAMSIHLTQSMLKQQGMQN